MKLILLAVICCTTVHILPIALLKTPPIAELDQQNMFNALYTFPEQLQQAINIGKRICLKHNYTNIRNILFMGMGDAGTAASIAKTLIEPTSKKPITLMQNYNLPAWVDQQTLVICISYLGTTKEVLSCFDQAHERHIPIMGICSEGILLDKLLDNDYDFVIVPSGLAQRAAFSYMLASLIYLVHHLEGSHDQIINDLNGVPAHIRKYRDLLSLKDVTNPTYLYAVNTKSYIPVIFGQTDSTACIAHYWAAQFAQNSKIITHVNNLPELTHQELTGWKNNPHLLKNCIVVWLSDVAMNERNKQRMELCKELLQGLPAVQIQFQGSGANWCQRLFYLLYFGDWISYWYAMEHATDPAPYRIHKGSPDEIKRIDLYDINIFLNFYRHIHL